VPSSANYVKLVASRIPQDYLNVIRVVVDDSNHRWVKIHVASVHWARIPSKKVVPPVLIVRLARRLHNMAPVSVVNVTLDAINRHRDKSPVYSVLQPRRRIKQVKPSVGIANLGRSRIQMEAYPVTHAPLDAPNHCHIKHHANYVSLVIMHQSKVWQLVYHVVSVNISLDMETHLVSTVLLVVPTMQLDKRNVNFVNLVIIRRRVVVHNVILVLLAITLMVMERSLVPNALLAMLNVQVDNPHVMCVHLVEP